MSRYLSEEDLKSTKVFIMAGDGPDANDVLGINKCLIPINGKPVVERMLEVFYDIGSKDIYMVGSENDIKKAIIPNSRLNYIDIEGLVSTKISKIANEMSFEEEEPVLYVFGDTPLFNKKALLNFVEKCNLDEAEFYHPIVPREYIHMFNEYFDRNYVFTREVDFRVNCMTLVKPSKLDLKYIQDISDYRKRDDTDPDFKDKTKNRGFLYTAYSAIGSGGLFTALKLLLNARLYRSRYKASHRFIKRNSSIKEIEKYASKIFSVRARTVITPYAESTLDIDADRDAITFIKNYEKLESIVKKEHEIIDFLDENSRIIESIANDPYISDSSKSSEFYSLIGEKHKLALRKMFKEDYFSFKRLIQIYSKKGPKAHGLLRR